MLCSSAARGWLWGVARAPKQRVPHGEGWRLPGSAVTCTETQSDARGGGGRPRSRWEGTQASGAHPPPLSGSSFPPFSCWSGCPGRRPGHREPPHAPPRGNRGSGAGRGGSVLPESQEAGCWPSPVVRLPCRWRGVGVPAFVILEEGGSWGCRRGPPGALTPCTPQETDRLLRARSAGDGRSLAVGRGGWSGQDAALEAPGCGVAWCRDASPPRRGCRADCCSTQHPEAGGAAPQ